MVILPGGSCFQPPRPNRLPPQIVSCNDAFSLRGCKDCTNLSYRKVAKIENTMARCPPSRNTLLYEVHDTIHRAFRNYMSDELLLDQVASNAPSTWRRSLSRITMPLMRLISCPFLKKIRVGIPSTFHWLVSVSFVSTSSLAKVTRSWYSSLTAANSGLNSWHELLRSDEKSTITICGALSTCSAKSWLVTSI